MDDYQETQLHEPDPRPGERKMLKRRRIIAWTGYAVACAVAVAAVLVLSGMWQI